MVELFSGPDLSILLDRRAGEAREWLAKRPEQDVLDDAASLAQEAIDRFEYEDITLGLYDVEISRPSEKTGDQGVYWSTLVHVPYTGGMRLMFFHEPKMHSSGPRLMGDELRGEIALDVVSTPQVDLKPEVQRALGRLETYVGWVNTDLEEWRSTLPAQLRSTVDARSKSIKARQAAAASVGYKVRD